MNSKPTDIQYDIQCPHCHQFTILRLFFARVFKIIIKCFCGYSSTLKYTDLSSFSKDIKKLILAQKCQNTSHSDKDATEFCFQCDKWCCPDCASNHRKYNKDHTLCADPSPQRPNCPFHSSKVKQIASFYCFICDAYYCKACIESSHLQKFKNKHYVLQINDIESHYQFFTKQFENAKKRVNYTTEVVQFAESKYKEDKKYEEKLKQIRVLFNDWKEKHEIYFDFVDGLVETYKKSNKDVKMMINLYNNAHFHINKIKIVKEDTVERKLEKIASFLFSNAIPPFETNTMNLPSNENFLYLLHDRNTNYVYENFDTFIDMISLRKKINTNDKWMDNYTKEEYNKIYHLLNLDFTDETNLNYGAKYQTYIEDKGVFEGKTFLSNGYLVEYSDKEIKFTKPKSNDVHIVRLPEEEYAHYARQIGNDLFGVLTYSFLYQIDINTFQIRTIIKIETSAVGKLYLFVKNGYYEIYVFNRYFERSEFNHFLTIEGNGEMSTDERKKCICFTEHGKPLILAGMTGKLGDD